MDSILYTPYPYYLAGDSQPALAIMNEPEHEIFLDDIMESGTEGYCTRKKRKRGEKLYL